MRCWPAVVLALCCGAAQAGPAASTEPEALHVLNRLGYGPAPGDVARVMASGVDRYIDEQLHPEQLADPPALRQRLATLAGPQRTQAALVVQFRAAAAAARGGDNAGRRALLQDAALEAAQARLWRAIESPRQLEEVMVEFWFNHFNVFAGKGLDGVLLESYEREAIRPFALGRFRDLLGATAHHPAMLFYLDNWLSSAPGRGRGGGLNENYARELMELHTLGVDGGYSQRDVTELARVFTGWTIRPGADGSAFFFDARRHDAGGKPWLNRTIGTDGEAGQAEGEHVLDVLAAHPATARHIAFQLAQAFVADQPPPALVRRLGRRFLDSDGDIRAVLADLFASPEFRDPAVRQAKFKTPYRFVVSAMRASGLPDARVQPLVAGLKALGMPLHGCLTPDGFANTEPAWLSPDALARRLDFATALASGRLPLDDGAAAPAAADALLATLGGSVSAATRAVVVRADPPLQAALVLGSLDFMHH